MAGAWWAVEIPAIFRDSSGARQSDPKSGNPADYPFGGGPQYSRRVRCAHREAQIPRGLGFGAHSAPFKSDTLLSIHRQSQGTLVLKQLYIALDIRQLRPADQTVNCRG